MGIFVLLPLFLQQKYRRFWIAFSISAIGMLTFSMSENIPSPVAGMLTEYLFQRTGNRDSSFFDDYSVNYAAGIVGKWYAINCVVRLHAALAFSFVAGIVWQKVGSSTPFWLIGTWLFLWSISISREITAAIGVDWTLLVGYLLSVTVIFVLPAIMIHIKKWKPFSVSFAISGCLGCFQLRKNAFDPTFFFSPTVAKWLPNMPSSVGEHVAYALVLGVAVLIGSVVQLAVSQFPTQIQNDDHSLE